MNTKKLKEARELIKKDETRQRAIDAFNNSSYYKKRTNNDDYQYERVNQLVLKYEGGNTVEWKDFKVLPVVTPKTYFYIGLVAGLNFGILIAGLIVVLAR